MKKLEWYNEPDNWEVIGHNSLSMMVTPKTDYWRETHYGFTVDDGPFGYLKMGGEFKASVQITGMYKNRFDQMGLMVRQNEKNWIKTGVEFVDGKINLSTVVTRDKSDWSVIELDEAPNSVWLELTRIKNAIKIIYSINGRDFKMMRLAYFPENTPLMVGVTAASPDGDGFKALFENLEIQHLPDSRRMEWLSKNQH